MEIITRIEARRLGFKTYFDGKSCRKGHVSERYTSTGACMDCSKSRDRSLSDSEAEHNRQRVRSWRENNLERARKKSREYHREVREQRKPYMQQYRLENRDKLRARQNERRKDPKRKLAHSISNLIRRSLKKNGYSKRTTTHSILGCSYEEFKVHIERQFLPGMTWENRDLWHIDHIVPVSSAKDEDEIVALNHVSNLRPLWATDNSQKSDKMLFLI